jgi:hypothetical protein
MEDYNMLIDKGISEGEVVTLKLTSGEELVAKLAEETATHYKLSKPLVLSMSAKGIGMVPYLFTVSPDKDVQLNKSTVTVIAASDKEFANQYLQGTTGITLA